MRNINRRHMLTEQQRNPLFSLVLTCMLAEFAMYVLVYVYLLSTTHSIGRTHSYVFNFYKKYSSEYILRGHRARLSMRHQHTDTGCAGCRCVETFKFNVNITHAHY